MPQDTQKTSKSRSDTAVQGTNDSSIVSKCSMVTRGYIHDEFVAHFVAKQSRRSSLINRGYYVRARALEHVFKSFFTWCEGKENQVISLGAGFDSAYFRLKSEGLLKRTRFVEVDFPDVVRRKIALIQTHPQLNQVLDDELKIPEKIQKLKDVCPLYSSPGYHIVGCDLKHVAKLSSCLEHCGIDCQLPTLILSECVITYMGSKSSNPVIQWAAEVFPHAMFVSYEQIYPHDAFGQVMCSHFRKIGSPLKSIEKFPTPKHHIQRYCTLGWASCDCIDMNELYSNILSQEETKRIDDLELFDEHEEFHAKCSHYMICCAFNGTCLKLKPLIKPGNSTNNEDDNRKTQSIPCSVYQCNPEGAIQRYGHASSLLSPTRVILTGGFGVTSGGHTKVSQVQVLDTGLGTITEVEGHDGDILDSRMHHTMTALTDKQLLLFGGRKSPAKPLSDSYLLNIVNNEKGIGYTCQRLQCPTEPEPRWRHSATVLDTGGRKQVVVHGGKTTEEVLSDLWLMDVDSREWSEVPVRPRPTPRHSHSCCAWASKLVLTGGLDDDGRPIGGIVIIDTADWTSHSLKSSQEIQPRYSHSSHVINDLLLLVGGVCLSPVTFGLTSINLLTGSISNYSLMVVNPGKPIMLFKTTSEFMEEERKLLVFGGGGNCFSFGTHFNATPISIDIAKVLTDQSC